MAQNFQPDVLLGQAGWLKGLARGLVLAPVSGHAHTLVAAGEGFEKVTQQDVRPGTLAAPVLVTMRLKPLAGSSPKRAVRTLMRRRMALGPRMFGTDVPPRAPLPRTTLGRCYLRPEFLNPGGSDFFSLQMSPNEPLVSKYS